MLFGNGTATLTTRLLWLTLCTSLENHLAQASSCVSKTIQRQMYIQPLPSVRPQTVRLMTVHEGPLALHDSDLAALSV